MRLIFGRRWINDRSHARDRVGGDPPLRACSLAVSSSGVRDSLQFPPEQLPGPGNFAFDDEFGHSTSLRLGTSGRAPRAPRPEGFAIAETDVL